MTMVAGSTSKRPALEFDLSGVTVFVGPNNSGKSRALQEIEAFVTSGSPPVGMVVKHIEFEPWEDSVIESELRSVQEAPGLDDVVSPDYIIISRMNPHNNSYNRVQIYRDHLLQEARNPNETRHTLAGFLSLFTLKLDGSNRLALANEQPVGDLQKPPTSPLWHLFVNNDARSSLRKIVFDAFGKHLVVDPTHLGMLRFRLSSRAPVDESEERGLDSRAVEFHGKATPIADASDGVKAFVGILATITAGAPKVTLLDEPEAFLHPSLSSKLGREVAIASQKTEARVFLSTHSAAILMGCVQSGVGVNIVRLTYDYETATARLLPREKLAHLMRNPLLRSVGVLNALFYNVVVVTESDADRAFYQEVNERLLAANDSRGIAGCLFLNAQNKQTVWDIVKPLRELGIPAAGIVDIDVLKEGGTVWNKPLYGAFIPELSHVGLQMDRSTLLKAFEETGKNMKRDGGVGLLPTAAQEACRNLFSKLAEYGVFVVESGELEAWLPEVSAGISKSNWLVSIFEKMGDEPSAPDYVLPKPGDVWDFLGKISAWASNPQHKGIPD